MRTVSDALIVGGGVIGLTTALALKRHGLSVTLLERHTCGRGASQAAGGILSPLPPWRCPQVLAELYRASPPCYRQLFGELHEQGEDIGLIKSGLLCLNSDQLPQLPAALQGEDDWRAKRLDADWFAQQRPRLKTERGVLFPHVYQLTPPALLAALVRMSKRNGVSLRERCTVRKLALHQGRVTGVHTAQEQLSADVVVLCAGAWLMSLLPASHHLLHAVHPVRGQMIEYTAEPRLLSEVVWSEDSETQKSYYLIPRSDGRVLVGSTLEACGFDYSITDRARAELSGFAERLLPALAQRPITRQWAGLRPAASRTAPLIGAHPEIEQLFINSGHYRDGIALAPVSAQLMAHWICGEKTAVAARTLEAIGDI